MSYKKAITLSAVGIGAFLQGCSKDDDDAVTDCNTLVEYESLLKTATDTAADETCLNCVASDEDVDDDKSETTPLQDWQAAWAKILAGTTDADKLIAVNALEDCGAKRIATACDGVSVTLASKDPTKLLEAFGAAAGTNLECMVSFKIGQPDTPTCESIKKGITESGGSATFDCSLGYECAADLVNYVAATTGATPPVSVAQTCLDCLNTGAGTGKDWNELSFANDEATMVAALEECDAQPSNQCGGITLTASELSFDTIKASTAVDANVDCQLCAQINLADSPTCAQSVAAFGGCGANVDAAKCGACDDFDATGTDCKACLDDAVSGTWADVVAPNSAVQDFLTAYSHFETCEASSEKDECTTAFALADLDLGDAATMTEVFEALVTQTSGAASCRHCVYYNMANARESTNTAAFTCQEFKTAAGLCHGSDVAHAYPTGCDSN